MLNSESLLTYSPDTSSFKIRITVFLFKLLQNLFHKIGDCSNSVSWWRWKQRFQNFSKKSWRGIGDGGERSLSFKCFCYCLLQFYHLLISMRWLLLNFKREFDYMEAIRLFEITSSRHLEVSSVEAELERGRERAKDFVKDSKFFHFWRASLVCR